MVNFADSACKVLASSLLGESVWQQIGRFLTTPGLTLFLLIGSALLVIGLLVLTLTRVGHRRPLTMCVILSVVAHILLLGYAYGTRLIFQYPAAQKPVPVNVHLLGYDEIEPQNDEPEDDASVRKFADDLAQAETESLDRPDVELPFEMERQFRPDANGPRDFQARPAPGELSMLDQIQPNFQIGDPAASSLDSLDSELPQPQLIEPESIEFRKRGEGEGEVREHQPDFEPANNEPDPAKEMQQVEIEPTIIDQNSFPGEEQRLQQFQSELVVPEADRAVANQFSAAIRGASEGAGETGNPDPISPSGNEAATEPQNRQQLLQQAAAARRLGDGKPMPAAFRLRTPATRASAAKLLGGSSETEAAVNSALKWLASVQQEDGHWCPQSTAAGREDKVYGHDRGGCGSDADSGITALATLAFLGAGHTHLEGEYQNNVQRALEYLVRNQAIDGDLSGGAKLFARMYCHSMSLLAISEALAMTGDQRLTPAVKRGVLYTVESQDKRSGGWRYQPGDRGDMSQFGWVVMALHSARHGGIKVEDATWQRMIRFHDSCRTGASRGLASYRAGEGPSTAMTAEALACAHFLGVDISPAAITEATSRIGDELPSSQKINSYYWYYATLALNQTRGEVWQRWNEQLQRTLLSQQLATGSEKGSWSPDGLWAGYGGRVYSTALSTMCLEVYYRYLPQGESAISHSANGRSAANTIK